MKIKFLIYFSNRTAQIQYENKTCTSEDGMEDSRFKWSEETKETDFRRVTSEWTMLSTETNDISGVPVAFMLNLLGHQ